MQTYKLLLDDDRHVLPAHVFVTAASASEVRARAAEMLLRSRHHCGVRAFVGRELRFSLGERRLRRRDRIGAS